jgi:hypothetical protein
MVVLRRERVNTHPQSVDMNWPSGIHFGDPDAIEHEVTAMLDSIVYSQV